MFAGYRASCRLCEHSSSDSTYTGSLLSFSLKPIMPILTLLRLAPVISSSFSLWFCVDQHLFLSTLITPENKERGAKILPVYFSHFFKHGLVNIFVLYGTSIVTGLANASGVAHNPFDETPSTRLYAVGAALSIAHFLFVPLIAPIIKAIVQDTQGDKTVENMKAWLRIHAARSVVVDLPAWLFFVSAAVKSLQAV